MSQRWKLAAIGILTVGATSLASTLTTAYLMRPPAAPAGARRRAGTVAGARGSGADRARRTAAAWCRAGA